VIFQTLHRRLASFVTGSRTTAQLAATMQIPEQWRTVSEQGTFGGLVVWNFPPKTVRRVTGELARLRQRSGPQFQDKL